MSKVEELREALQEHIVEFGATLLGDIADDISDLIAAARLEGAEAEREKILAESKAMGDTEVDDFPTAYLVPASLLSPAPKEEK
jgi:hypothetical protein